MEFRGIYEDGVVRPTGPVNLPEGTEVEFQPTVRPAAKGSSGDFWRVPTLEELAREQGVQKPVSPGDLRGDWPEEDSIDEFLRQVREGRR